MKRSYKKLLSVLGATCLAVPFVGCEVDAQETSDSQTNNSAASASSAGDGGTTTNSIALAEGDSSTNAPAAAIATGDTNASQIVIVQKIPPSLPSDVKLSKGVEEVVKLAQTGVSETVVLLFIEKSYEPF